MSDEELNANVGDEVKAAVDEMWSAFKNMAGEPKLCRQAIAAIYYAAYHCSKACFSPSASKPIPTRTCSASSRCTS